MLIPGLLNITVTTSRFGTATFPKYENKPFFVALELIESVNLKKKSENKVKKKIKLKSVVDRK